MAKRYVCCGPAFMGRAMTHLFARAVAFLRDEDLEVELLVLAEQADGSGRRLELQRPLTTTADDTRLGIDTYCLVNETGATYYGGVDAWSVDNDVLYLELSAAAANTLGITDGYVIRLVNGRESARDVSQGLKAILEAS